MPTLIRILVVLLVLGGIAYGGMLALVMTVTPTEKDVTIRIPQRELVAAPERDPLVRREIDTTRTAPAATDTPAPEAAPGGGDLPQMPAPAPDTAPDVQTLAPGVE